MDDMAGELMRRTRTRSGAKCVPFILPASLPLPPPLPPLLNIILLRRKSTQQPSSQHTTPDTTAIIPAHHTRHKAATCCMPPSTASVTPSGSGTATPPATPPEASPSSLPVFLSLSASRVAAVGDGLSAAVSSEARKRSGGGCSDAGRGASITADCFTEGKGGRERRREGKGRKERGRRDTLSRVVLQGPQQCS